MKTNLVGKQRKICRQAYDIVRQREVLAHEIEDRRASDSALPEMFHLTSKSEHRIVDVEH